MHRQSMIHYPRMPAVIALRGIAKAYVEPLFADLTLAIQERERLAIVGPNGSGKSTLLGIIAGRITPDAGERHLSGAGVIEWVAQEEDFAADATPRSVLTERLAATAFDAGERERRLIQMLARIGFADDAQPVSTLSGGWRKRLALGRALVVAPDLLCLDEPTNHLDLAGVLWLEDLLASLTCAVALVSHDRAFLDRVATRIVAIDRIFAGGLFAASGGYADFLSQRAEYLASQQQLEERLANRWRREAEWLRRRPKARTTKAAFRVTAADQLQGQLAEVAGRNRQERRAALHFNATGRRANELIEAESIALAYGEKRLFADLDVQLAAGERLGIIGLNGSGKTSLLRVLGGEISPDAGRIKHAHGLRLLRFSQHREQLDRTQTLRQHLAPEGETVEFAGGRQHVIAWAKRFLFRPDQLEQRLGALSGGEQARALLAGMMAQAADVLLLDEPTNDLDIPTLEVLEDALRDFPGGVILISHDRYLLDRLIDRAVALDGQGGATTVASYGQWEDGVREALRAAAREREQAAASLRSQMPRDKPVQHAGAVLSRKELGELKRLEERIDACEAQLAAWRAQLNQPAVYAHTEEVARIERCMVDCLDQQLGLMERWEALEERRS